MFRRSTIKFRILSILGLLMGGYLLLLAMVHVTASNTHDHMQRISASLFPAALRLQEAEACFAQVTRNYSDAVILQDSKKLRAAEQEADKLTGNLMAVRDDEQASIAVRRHAGELLDHFNAFRERSRQTYGVLVVSPDDVTPELQASILRLARDNNDLTAELQALDREIAGSFQQELAFIDRWSVRSLMTTWGMLIGALLGSAAGWYVLHFRVLVPLDRLTLRMRDIAEGDGDLTGRVDIHGNDEVDEAARWFNIFIERIEQIVLRVMQNAHGLAESSSSLASIARATSTHATEQRDQAMLITASMNDISAAIDGISRNTQNAARNARANEQDAQVSGETLLSTVQTIQQLLSANRQTSSKIAELSHASDAIGKVIGVINDIAGQTNLLALNASIESARAGVHGQGFAVVAGEVRRLADRTRVATREIEETVGAMQAGTSEVIEAMRSSMRHVESGVSSANAAGETLKNIIHGSEGVQKMVSQIAVASSEQSHATRSVNENLGQIASIIEKTTNSSARAVEGCDRVSELATDLTRLVGAFKVRAVILPGGSAARAEDGVRRRSAA